MRSPGFVYVMVSATRPGLVKVGKTTSPPSDCTGDNASPTDRLELRDAAYFSNFDAAESFVHEYLEEYKFGNEAEYFQVPVETALQALSLAAERLVGTRTTNAPAAGGMYESVPQSTGGLTGLELLRKAHEYRDRRDFESAIRYYTRAAAQREASAYIALSEMTLKGEGCAADEKKATEWLVEGARNGARECSGILADWARKDPPTALPHLRAYFHGLDFASLDPQVVERAVVRMRFYLQFCRGRVELVDQQVVPAVLDALQLHPAHRELASLWKAAQTKPRTHPLLIFATVLIVCGGITVIVFPSGRSAPPQDPQQQSVPSVQTTPVPPETTAPVVSKPDEIVRKPVLKTARSAAAAKKSTADQKTKVVETVPSLPAPPTVVAAPVTQGWSGKITPVPAAEPPKTQLSVEQLKDHFEVNRSRADAAFRNESIRITDTVTKVGKHDVSLGKVKCKFDEGPPARLEPGMSVIVEGTVRGKAFLTGTITMEHCRVMAQ